MGNPDCKEYLNVQLTKENKYFGLAIGFYFLSHQTTKSFVIPDPGPERPLVEMWRSKDAGVFTGGRAERRPEEEKAPGSRLEAWECRDFPGLGAYPTADLLSSSLAQDFSSSLSEFLFLAPFLDHFLDVHEVCRKPCGVLWEIRRTVKVLSLSERHFQASQGHSRAPQDTGPGEADGEGPSRTEEEDPGAGAWEAGRVGRWGCVRVHAALSWAAEPQSRRLSLRLRLPRVGSWPRAPRRAAQPL